jgi:hypothetical protein
MTSDRFPQTEVGLAASPGLSAAVEYLPSKRSPHQNHPALCIVGMTLGIAGLLRAAPLMLANQAIVFGSYS